MRKYWTGVLAVALLLSLAWGYNQYRVANEYRTIANNQNQRSLQDFAAQLDELETDMAKGQVANSATQMSYYLGQAFSRSQAASQNLAQLPAEQTGLSYMGQFLTQTGDFARTLSQRLAGGGTLTAAETKTLSDIHGRLLEVNRKVQDLVLRMNTENLAWTDPKPKFNLGWTRIQLAEAAAEGQEGVAGSVRGGLDQLDASLQKLPPFDYTGEFSSRSVQKPLGLPAGEVSKEQAQSIAKEFLAKVGYPGVVPQFTGDVQEPFAGYVFQHAQAYVEVSRQGGVVRIYRDQRPLQVRTLGLDEAKRKAMDILKGMPGSLVLTSTEDNGAYVQVEAVSEENGIRLYPDKVRIMVALDNGQITGYDATPFWAFHHARELPAPKLTLAQAASKLHTGLKVSESRKALIAMPGNREVLSYEFRGRYQGEDYLLYINAVSGTEEKIQRIIHTPRGEYLQ